MGQLGKHLAAYEDYLKKLGGHLGTTVNMYNASYKEFAKVNKDVLKITGAEGTPQRCCNCKNQKSLMKHNTRL